jgi:hypothetical protein
MMAESLAWSKQWLSQARQTKQTSVYRVETCNQAAQIAPRIGRKELEYNFVTKPIRALPPVKKALII